MKVLNDRNTFIDIKHVHYNSICLCVCMCIILQYVMNCLSQQSFFLAFFFFFNFPKVSSGINIWQSLIFIQKTEYEWLYVYKVGYKPHFTLWRYLTAFSWTCIFRCKLFHMYTLVSCINPKLSIIYLGKTILFLTSSLENPGINK